MAKPKIKGAKRGRKAGSVSFCRVTLEELNRVLKPSANVIVSLRFAGMVGITGQKIVSDTGTIAGIASSKDVEVSLENFDEEGVKPQLTLETFGN